MTEARAEMTDGELLKMCERVAAADKDLFRDTRLRRDVIDLARALRARLVAGDVRNAALEEVVKLIGKFGMNGDLKAVLLKNIRALKEA